MENNMKITYVLLIALSFLILPVLVQARTDPNEIMSKIQTALDLQEDQVNNITPIIQKYDMEFHDLQKSMEDGTSNQSTINNQWQDTQAAETQELSQYLKPYQLSQWRSLQSQFYPIKDEDNN